MKSRWGSHGGVVQGESRAPKVGGWRGKGVGIELVGSEKKGVFGQSINCLYVQTTIMWFGFIGVFNL